MLAIDDWILEDGELEALAEIGSPQSVLALINLFQVRDEKVRYTHYFEEEMHPAEIALQKWAPGPFLP